MGYMDNYNKWLNDEYFDVDTKAELKGIESDEKELEDRFYKDLDFGTGGIRGILGAGTNRMNIYTVSRATQGLANIILKQGERAKQMGVAIAHDPRKMSKEFCMTAALVLNANGIKTYIFDDLRPTPMLSFAVRHIGAIAGIVITASHNPKEYNGYKVYWSDGAQVASPFDTEIINEVNAISDFRQVKITTLDAMVDAGLFHRLTKETDDAFINCVKSVSLNPELIKTQGAGVTIVYTPFNGAGNMPVRRVLSEMGFSNVHVVKEQELPDENFTTVGYPNPEDPKAFKLALKLADEVKADIILATDPDSDRLGVVVKNKNDEYVFLNGNMTGTIIAEYILSQRKLQGTMPENAAIVSTVVSSNLTEQIAKFYGVEYFEVLTGFKYIGGKIKDFEQAWTNEYLFGFEESFGCLAGTFCRDKDAVGASLLMCEILLYYKQSNLSILDQLDKMYKKYGYYKESIETITLAGIEGLGKIANIINTFQNNPPKQINNIAIVATRDYKNSVRKNIATQEVTKIDLPTSDVLYYEMADGSWFCVRPSGTEPKIKIYFGVIGENDKDASEKLQDFKSGVMAEVSKI